MATAKGGTGGVLPVFFPAPVFLPAPVGSRGPSRPCHPAPLSWPLRSSRLRQFEQGRRFAPTIVDELLEHLHVEGRG